MTPKNTLTVAFALLALNLPMAAAHAHAEHGKPQFGGVVAEAGEVQCEIVAKDGKITVHVSNHGNPVDVSGASRAKYEAVREHEVAELAANREPLIEEETEAQAEIAGELHRAAGIGDDGCRRFIHAGDLPFHRAHNADAAAQI